MSYGFTQQILPDEDTGRSRGIYKVCCCLFFFSSRRRHTRYWRDWSSDVCSSDLAAFGARPLFEADLLVRVAAEGVNEAKTPEEVLRYVSEVRPFIELSDLVLAEGEAMNGPTITAINVGARQGVTGAPIAVERTPEFLRALADMNVTVTDSAGQEIVKAPGKAVLGHPLNSV